MVNTGDRRRSCGCGQPVPALPAYRPPHFRPERPERPDRPDRPCPCPCGWIPRPENCERVYDECRWCGMSRDECERRRAECERKWEDWPFYRGPCPKGDSCASVCACTPVTASYGLFTARGEICLQPERNMHFNGEYVESRCVKRSRGGARVEAAGVYLVTVTMDLADAPCARVFVTLDGEEVKGGDACLKPSPMGVHVCFTAIVTASAGSVIGVSGDGNADLRCESDRVSMTVIRLA